MLLNDVEIELAESASRLCLFAHFDEDDVIADHVIYYLSALKASGFMVLVASTAALDHEQAAKLRSHCDGVELRANVGLDFASWKHLIAKLDLSRTQQLLLCNDSVYGPLTDLTEYLAKLTRRDADFYGVCASIMHEYHLQSWFILFNPRAFNSRAFFDFFGDRSVPSSKRDIIIGNEVRLTKVLVDAGLRYVCAYDPLADGFISRHVPINAAHQLWRQLVETNQVPFIKIDLMRDNPLAIADVAGRRLVVAPVSKFLDEAIEHDLRRRKKRAGPSGRSPMKLTWLGRFGVVDPVFRPELRHFIIRDFEAARDGRSFTMLANGVFFLGLRFAYRAFGRVMILLRERNSKPSLGS